MRIEDYALIGDYHTAALVGLVNTAMNFYEHDKPAEQRAEKKAA